MYERIRLERYVGDGYSVAVVNIRQSPDKILGQVRLIADQVVFAALADLSSPDGRRRWARAASGPGRPSANDLLRALDDLLPDLAAVLEERMQTKLDPVKMLLGDVELELWHSKDRIPWLSVPINGHHEHLRFGSMAAKRWLAARLFELEGKPPSSGQIANLSRLLEYHALQGPDHPVSTRLTQHDGYIYLDLGDATHQAVEIGPNGWRLVNDPPVRFLRPAGLAPLPTPERGGSLASLRPYINVGSAHEFALVIAWLAAAFRPQGPYPILVIQGEQGTAKSTVSRVLRALVDPNTSPIRSEPRELQDLMIAATHAWVLAFDNLSRLTPTLSDALCRLATGGGLSSRKRYTDDDEVLFQTQRPIILNGIAALASRPDLLDRALVLELPVIPKHQRRDEAGFWTAFSDAQPQLLGALLDAVSVALRRLPYVQLPELPRMADFATWATAAEPGLGLANGSFLAAYAHNQEVARGLVLESSPVAVAITKLVEQRPRWEGTASELLILLEQSGPAEERRQRLRSSGWPKNPRGLSEELKRVQPVLRELGIIVERGRSKHGSAICISTET